LTDYTNDVIRNARSDKMRSTEVNPDSGQLTELRATAEALRARLEGLKRPRPLFVEFSGSPKSGKSTCIDIVGHFFRRLGFNTLAPTEGASKRTPYYLKDNLVAFNAWSACYALNHVLEGLYSSDGYDIAILDRGLFDALVWFEVLEGRGELTEDERRRIQSFLLIDNWREVIDAVFLFRADPETSLEREARDKLVADYGRAMNPDFLMGLNDAYSKVRDEFGSQFKAVIDVDTSAAAGTTPQSTAFEVAKKIMEFF
jgi:hypothetical protein